ncbi:hypothetical protein [Paracraurococcus lichenis]|uniref:Uncharacterized protein n=1 Tax=Paracraurococcus lichenis TaxID=3064888 RepID=A0ABT9EAX1_9PROT|nr:hypothetical protein [Paracraurococcus sp. LOR1-02]MDO9713357.1 hypothetical protein [Paracraurococcus sp. LOR1-02]
MATWYDHANSAGGEIGKRKPEDRRMQEWAGPEEEGSSEASAHFVMIIQGAMPWAGMVQGIAGVKEALLRILWSDPGTVVLEGAATLLASLDEPKIWAAHGTGDGRPYWHCWFGYEEGSVTIQRLTEPAASDFALGRLRSRLNEIFGVLIDCAADLRKLTATSQREGLVTHRCSGRE